MFIPSLTVTHIVAQMSRLPFLICIHIYTHTHIYICIYLHIHIHICINICTHIYTRIYMFTPSLTLTHMGAQTSRLLRFWNNQLRSDMPQPWYYGWALLPPPPHQYALQKRHIICQKETYHTSKRELSHVQKRLKHTCSHHLRINILCKRDLSYVKKRPITRHKETWTRLSRDTVAERCGHPPPPHQYVLQKKPITCRKEGFFSYMVFCLPMYERKPKKKPFTRQKEMYHTSKETQTRLFSDTTAEHCGHRPRINMFCKKDLSCVQKRPIIFQKEMYPMLKETQNTPLSWYCCWALRPLPPH